MTPRMVILAAEQACINLERLQPASAEFWRRLAGALRKALTML